MKAFIGLALVLIFSSAIAQDYERHRGVKQSSPVSIKLDQAKPAARLSVPPFSLVLHHVDHRKAGSFTWYGNVSGYPHGRAILTSVDGSISGYIYLSGKPNDPLYEIRTDAKGNQSLVELDPLGFPDAKRDTGEAIGTPSPGGDVKGDTGATIDVMVLYTNQTALAAGSAIGAQIQNAIDVTNQVYLNSGITFRLNPIYVGQVAHDELGDQVSDVNWLASDATVASLRNSKYADLVALYVEESGGYCGYSYGIGPSVNIAWSVVNRGCAVGNLSFPHELGHLMGARHDVYVDPSTSPYAYGHGWVDCVEGWRTVMAYPTQCGGTRLPYFSTPLLNYGTPADPMGSALTADNVRVLNGNAVTIANYRSATAPPPPPVSCSLSASNATPAIGTNLTLTASCVGSPTSYVWTNCASTSNKCVATKTTIGPATYSVTASNGVTSSVASVSVNWIEAPPCRLRGNSGKCK